MESYIYRKVIPQSTHQPELYPSKHTNFVYDQRPPNGHEGEDTSHTYLDPVHFPRSKLSQIEVPVHPIRNTSYH
ncbi:hypothetical protein YC2023_087872 [Brassica napus]